MEEENITEDAENNIAEESVKEESAETAQDEGEKIPQVEEETQPEKQKAKAKPKAKGKAQAEPTEPVLLVEPPAPKRRGRPKGSLNKVKPVTREAEDDDDSPPVSASRSSYQNPPERTISAIASLLQDFEERQAARQSIRSQFYSSFLPR